MSNNSSERSNDLLEGATNALLLTHKLRLLDIEARHRLHQYRTHFNPNQLRVPAGHHDGGQWTKMERYAAAPNLAGSQGRHAASDADDTWRRGSKGPAAPQEQHAATEIKIDPKVWTGISNIDNTTKALAHILISAAETVEYVPGLSPSAYGIAVHVAFAAAVRIAKLPGIGFRDVETTFSVPPGTRYGSKDSVRTDVVLRNDAGEIIAIYDVKTGGADLDPRRVKALLTKTGTAQGTPVIQLHLSRGLSRKAELYENGFPVGRSALSLQLAARRL